MKFNVPAILYPDPPERESYPCPECNGRMTSGTMSEDRYLWVCNKCSYSWNELGKED